MLSPVVSFPSLESESFYNLIGIQGGLIDSPTTSLRFKTKNPYARPPVFTDGTHVKVLSEFILAVTNLATGVL